jgi:TonB-linked SusC/RagA family outer membrane protein
MKNNETPVVSHKDLFIQKLARIMKITTALLLLVCMQVSAIGFSQSRITIKMASLDLKKALFEVEKKTDYRFLFAEEVVKGKPKVTINMVDATLDEIMGKLLVNTGINYKILGTNLVVLKETNSATKDLAEIVVKGRITSASGESLSGVSIQVKGTQVGTTSDNTGAFAITVADENAKLLISYIGYEPQEISVAGKRDLSIILTTAVNNLEQVVVTGYGTQRKRDLTGSVTTIKGEELAKMPNTNPISSLQGRVAGLTVANSGVAGASPVVRIRGVNSTNSASPVYVVDGILQDNIDFLNPADIETIDILRDPSSIAIYGLRGANGVIAITSKKAARGQTRINFQSTVGFQKVTDKIKVTDAAGFKKLYDAQLANINAAPFDYSNYTANTNWQNEILQNALLTTNNLSVSNNSEKSSTYLNIGYNKQDGVVKYNSYEKFMIRLNQEIRFNSNIKVGGEINASHWIQNPAGVSLTNALWAAPIVPIQQNATTYYSMPSFQRAQVGNPIAALNRNNGTDINKGFRFIGSLYAEVKFLNDFTFKSSVFADLGFNNSRSYTPLPFTFINQGEGTAPTTSFFDNTVRTGVSQEMAEFKRYQQDHTLTYDKKLGDGHKLTALVGFTSIYSVSTNINGNRRDTSVNVPNNPDFWYISTINANNPGLYGGGGGESAIMGMFGRLSYAYQNKYLVNATLRRDGSSKFAPQNRWGTFGSVGLGWIASEESFVRKFNFINFLKLRAAWGETGNANGFADNLFRPGISNASTAIFGNNVYTAIQAAYIPDPNLRWEVVRGLDIGFDLKTLRNRLNVEFTYYNRTTSDILTAVTLPNETRSYFTNLGKITNQGIELSLNWTDKIGKDITYSIAPNFSYNKNTVNSIGDKINFQLFGNGGANLTETGQSIGYFFGYRQIGIYQSTAELGKMARFGNSLPGDIAYADINGDGLLTPADRTYLGTPFPPFSYGLNINVAYKGFDFTIEGQGVAGNKIYTQRRIANFATLNYEANRLNAWTGGGTTNVEPILDNTRGNNFLFSSYYLEPGDYFRLRTLQIGYTFSEGLLRRVGISKARVFVNGQNIKSWSQVTGYSPEAQIGSILGGGADNGTFPVPAVYSMGINVTF